MTRPLVTLVLYAYNEAAFIAEAVQSALAQDYHPLEIVLCDDGSQDETFGIMQELAASSASHRVLLHRNPHNIGIGSLLNWAVTHTTGDLVLLANGDDRSRPYRVTRTVDAWLGADRTPSALTSPLQVIDKHGREVPGKLIPNATRYRSLAEGLKHRFMGVGAAASLALRREVFIRFPPLNPALILEDNPLIMRASLLGSVLSLDEPLVEYRVHDDNISQAYAQTAYGEWAGRFRARRLWHRREGVKAFCQMLNDLNWPAARSGSDDDWEYGRFVAITQLLDYELARQHHDPDSRITAGQRLRLLFALMKRTSILTVKSWLPFLGRRDERWHYRAMLAAGWEDASHPAASRQTPSPSAH
jgi:glycosyltransferase involved in cell wall biosynthesis